MIFYFRSIYRVVYWILPPVLLYFILSRIEYQIFINNLSNVNIWFLIIGIGFYCPTLILIAGFRWKITLSEFCRHSPPLGYLIRHYWIGIALGFFSPGQIGLDVYRVILVGEKYHYHLKMIFAILVEKAMALLNAVLLVYCLYPLVYQFVVYQSNLLEKIVNVSFFIGITSLIFGGFLLIAARQRVAHRFANYLSTILLRFIARMRGTIKTEAAEKEAKDVSNILTLLANPRPFFLVFIASMAIQFATAAGNQIIFQAVGTDIPFLVNLFVIPILYFIFLLPISFGSLGVREGSYILLYRIFGVSAEIALLVSFINLTGILLNNAVGAVLIWGKPKGKIITIKT